VAVCLATCSELPPIDQIRIEKIHIETRKILRMKDLRGRELRESGQNLDSKDFIAKILITSHLLPPKPRSNGTRLALAVSNRMARIFSWYKVGCHKWGVESRGLGAGDGEERLLGGVGESW
jgi:hypothetical protein